MPFPISCPACDARMTAPDEVVGKRIKCKKCGEAFVAAPVDQAEFEEDVPASPAKPKPPKVPSKPVARDEEEDVPRRKSEKLARASSDRDDKPRRRSEEDDEPPRKSSKREQADSPKRTNILLALLLGFGGILLSAALTYGAYHFLEGKEPEPNQPPPPTGGNPSPQPGSKTPPKGGVPFPGSKTK